MKTSKISQNSFLYLPTYFISPHLTYLFWEFINIKKTYEINLFTHVAASTVNPISNLNFISSPTREARKTCKLLPRRKLLNQLSIFFSAFYFHKISSCMLMQYFVWRGRAVDGSQGNKSSDNNLWNFNLIELRDLLNNFVWDWERSLWGRVKEIKL